MRVARSIAQSFRRAFSVALGDMRSLSRARGLGIERTLFVGVLLIAVLAGWPPGYDVSVATLNEHGADLFRSFLMGAYLSSFFLVPVLFASCFSAERRGSDGLLIFTTPIRSVELVAGRFASHFLRVIVLLSCAIPVLFASTMFGGVGDQDLARGAIGLVSLTVMLAGLTMLVSLVSGGGSSGGVAVIVLLLGEGLAVALLTAVLTNAGLGNAYKFTIFLVPHFLLLMAVTESPGMIPEWGFAIAAAACTTAGLAGVLASAALLRPVCLLSLSRGSARRFAPFWKRPVVPAAGSPLMNAPAPARGGVYRGPVWNNPVAWKEFRVSASAAGWFDKWVSGLIFWGGFPLLLLLVLLSGMDVSDANGLIIGFELAVASMIVIGRSSTAMTREHERNEFETMACTPLRPIDLLFGKWAGVLRAMIPIAVVLGLHFSVWFLAAIMPKTYMNQPFYGRMMPPLVALISFAATLATVGSIGLAVSIGCRKNSTATGIATGALLAWWILIPAAAAKARLDFFFEATGAFNPFYVCCGWAALDSKWSYDTRLSELVSASVSVFVFCALASALAGLWFLRRYPRATRG